MKILFLFFVTLLIINSSYGQNGIKYAKLRHADSIQLVEVWRKFNLGFVKKDIKALHQLSLNFVECNMSLITQPHYVERGVRYISIDSFLFRAYNNLSKSKFWSFQVYQISGYHPPNLKYHKNHSLKIYEVWFDTPETNPKKSLIEGRLYAFEFVKINNSLKFFGITSSP